MCLRRSMHRPLAAAGLLVAFVSAFGCASKRPSDARYVFGWPFVDTAGMAVRGGTTRGGDVVLARGESSQWKALQAEGLSPFERDRAAILAMAGDYRASFDFLETVVFEPPFTPAAPYRSWGTERVYVIEDRGDFISLQHVLEMVYVDADGNLQGPFVQKHWRQDWQFEPTSLHEYVGRRRWQRRTLGPDERRGRWSQSVYQVDDTPRYASVGAWEHGPSMSSWTGGTTGRPLPRRESSVRKDYDLLSATNRHTILPNGWVHEEDNVKTVLADSSSSAPAARAREMGVNRYQLLRDFDFTPADEYWSETGPVWAEARRAWREKLARSDELRVATKCGDTPVYQAMFSYAEKLRGETAPTKDEIRVFVDDLLECVTGSPGSTVAESVRLGPGGRRD